MRLFSKFEKKFIKRIIELDNSGEELLNVHLFFNGLLNIKSQVTIIGRHVNYVLKDGESHYHQIEILGDKTQTSSDYFEVTNRFYEANDLMDYLYENGYLIRYEGSFTLGLLINMQEIDESNENTNKIEVYNNTPLKELLKKFSFYYKPKETLKDLVKHKFRSQDDRNSSTTRFIAIASILVSFSGVLINYGTNYLKGKDDKQIISIDSSSLNYFKSEKNIRIDTQSLNYLAKLLQNQDNIIKVSVKTPNSKDTVKGRK